MLVKSRGSNFTIPDFSWREFTCDFFSILGNWVIANEKAVPLNSLLRDIVHCLEQIVEDIDTLLDSSYVDDLDDLVSNVLNNQVFDYAYKDGFERLEKNVFAYQKKNLSISKKVT